ncbi:MAG: hypothetical protein MUD08_11785, partial [Cytophagales bacterium]|nr:hypothetical protein [Cytophagales bacterium]
MVSFSAVFSGNRFGNFLPELETSRPTGTPLFLFSSLSVSRRCPLASVFFVSVFSVLSTVAFIVLPERPSDKKRRGSMSAAGWLRASESDVAGRPRCPAVLVFTTVGGVRSSSLALSSCFRTVFSVSSVSDGADGFADADSVFFCASVA